MESCMNLVKQYYRDGKILNLNIGFDSELQIKCDYCLWSYVKRKNERGEEVQREYRWYITMSNYRFQISSFSPLTKEEQADYEQVFGQLIRENRSKFCTYFSNKWSIPDSQVVKEMLDFLINPLGSQKKPTLMKRIVSSNKF